MPLGACFDVLRRLGLEDSWMSRFISWPIGVGESRDEIHGKPRWTEKCR